MFSGRNASNINGNWIYYLGTHAVGRGRAKHIVAAKCNCSINRKKNGKLSIARVTYKYMVTGKEYQGERVSFPGPTQNRQVDQHPIGQNVTAYYDPSVPSEACLERGLEKTDSTINWFVGWCTIVCGIVMVPVLYFAKSTDPKRY
jgi:hypothetical protein